MNNKIKSINGLKKIHFYTRGNNLNYLSLEVESESQNIELNYKSEYFNDLVMRVIEVYKKEYKNNNIILVGDITREILSGKFIVNTNNLNYGNSYNILYNREINEIKLRDYIYLIINNLATRYGYNNLIINGINKIRYSYLVSVSNPDMNIPIKIDNYSDRFIDLNFKFINNYTCNMDLNFNKEIIKVYNDITDEILIIEFDIDKNNFAVINKGEELIQYYEYDNKISDIENSVIRRYLDVIDDNFNNLKGIKSIFNNYILNSDVDLDNDEKNIKNINMSLSKDIVFVRYSDSHLYKFRNKDFSDAVLLPYYDIVHNVNIIMLDKNYLLMQDKIDNKYKYTLIKVSDINNLFDSFKVEEKIILDDSIKNKNEVIKLVNKHRGR